MSAAARPPALAPHGTIWIPSQKGETCGSDLLFTILEESDVLGNCYFKHLFETSEAGIYSNDYLRGEIVRLESERRLTGQDKARLAFYYYLVRSINRYEQLRALAPPGRVPLMRAKSNSEKLGDKATRLISKAKAGTGAYCEDIRFLARVIVQNNEIGFLPKALNGKITILDTPGSIDSSKIFAIIFLLTFPTHGHFVGFFKKNGRWYFSDDNVGVLHLVEDDDFVPTLIKHYNAIGSNSIGFYPSSRYSDRGLEYRIILANTSKSKIGINPAGSFYEYLGGVPYKTTPEGSYSVVEHSMFFNLDRMSFDDAHDLCADHDPFPGLAAAAAGGYAGDAGVVSAGYPAPAAAAGGATAVAPGAYVARGAFEPRSVREARLAAEAAAAAAGTPAAFFAALRKRKEELEWARAHGANFSRVVPVSSPSGFGPFSSAEVLAAKAAAAAAPAAAAVPIPSIFRPAAPRIDFKGFSDHNILEEIYEGKKTVDQLRTAIGITPFRLAQLIGVIEGKIPMYFDSLGMLRHLYEKTTYQLYNSHGNPLSGGSRIKKRRNNKTQRMGYRNRKSKTRRN